jgi:glutathione synthase
MLECSMAIKCPSIDLHLATFKKFQQSFSDENLLRKVCGSETTTQCLKELFKGIWSLEDLCKERAEVNEVVEKALCAPHEFVLKP